MSKVGSTRGNKMMMGTTNFRAPGGNRGDQKNIYSGNALKLLRPVEGGPSLKDYSFIKVIGEGGFGQVFLVKDNRGNAPVALKKILISLNGQYMTD